MSFDKIVKYYLEHKPQADTVGSIDFGILAATWSPDESLLALITGTSATSATSVDSNRDPRRQQVDVDDFDLRRSIRGALAHRGVR